MRVLVCLVAALLSTACDRTEKQVAHATSPLLGAWTRDGDTPAPNPSAPQFTKLTFKSDGSLEATYVAAGGALAGVIKKAPKVMQESDTYTLVDEKTVRIAEGSSTRNYSFDVHDGKLYLTPPGASAADVFSKSTDS